MSKRPRYFVEKKGGKGPIYYWQPSKDLRRIGFFPERLPNDRDQAIARAEEINRDLPSLRDRVRVKVVIHRPEPVHPGGIAAPRSQSVYVLGFADGPVKIGRAYEPHKRLSIINTGSPKRATLYLALRWPGVDAARLELEAHAAIGRRLNGEWFNVTPAAAIVEVIRLAHQMARRRQEQNVNRGMELPTNDGNGTNSEHTRG